MRTWPGPLVAAIVVCALAGLGVDEPRADGQQSKSAGMRYALLVGVTTYDRMLDHSLEGPANDVLLVKEMLVQRFGFAAENIVTLAEAEGRERRPTRAHIQAAFARLAKRIQAGDQVYIHLSGHGSQQLDLPPLDETDGLDEVFLPADAGPFDADKKIWPNAIIDDELGAWTKTLLDAGAKVTVVVDSCHSGTALRGKETLRELPIPKIAGLPTPKSSEEHAFDLATKAPGLVALYAAQPDEKAPELPPSDGSSPRKYGLLTYTLCKLLTQALAPLTYREVAQRIHAEYVHEGRTNPTPFVEGADADIDREFLGLKVWPGRSRLALLKDPAGVWKVSGGSLHGLTKGSVLALYPPPGQANANKVLGHVRVTQCLLAEAVVAPCAHGGIAEPAELWPGSRCEVVLLDYGLRNIKVAFDASARKALGQDSARLSSEASLFTLVDAVKDAEWIVSWKDGTFVLVEGRDFAERGIGGSTALAVPTADGLSETLRKIARAKNLLALATSSAEKTARGEAGLRLNVEMLKLKKPTDEDGAVLHWSSAGLLLKPGDLIAFRITNPNRNTTLDVTLLWVDSKFGIASLPASRFRDSRGKADNRFYPKQSKLTPAVAINDKTIGLEHVAVIALKASGPPADFSFLEQPSLADAQKLSRGQPAFASPLGELFQHFLYAHGKTRGHDTQVLDQYFLSLQSFTIRAGK